MKLAYLLEKPDSSTNAIASIKVKIAHLGDYKNYKKIYEENKNKEILLCVGGPAAQDQAIIAKIIPQINHKLEKIIFINRDYKESNVAHSAKQYHIRHANALNADPHLTGRNIIKTILKRLFLRVKERDVMQSDFLKINVAPTLNLKTLGIYLGNEINSIKQSIRHFCGKLTEHDINRIGAFLGGEFFKILEEKIGVKISGRSEHETLEHPSAIHITFNENEINAAEVDNKILENIDIHHQELTSSQIKDFFGENSIIAKAYGYWSDTHVAFDINEINKDFALKNNIIWHDNTTITKIFLTPDSSLKPKIAGVEDDNGNFIYCSKMHFSGGYKVDYVYDKASQSRFLHKSPIRNFINKLFDRLNLVRPISSNLTIATGVSINAIFKKTAKFGEISVTNSHWTKIAENDQYMLVRITGGGNTGSEEYRSEYALNVIANTRRIFGDNLVGILSAYGCSRSVNAKNSTEMTMLAKGLIISYGKGGTGNTKRHFEALKALYKLGFEKEVIDFCNQYNSSRGGKLGNNLEEIIKLSSKDFFHDDIVKTKKRMGF